MSDNQSIIGRDVIFKGKISNSKTIEINVIDNAHAIINEYYVGSCVVH